MSTLPYHVRLARIVTNLLRHVPDPPAPVARPTGSFASLKVGQRIVGPTGGEWCVAATDSQGAELVNDLGDRLRLTDRAWRTTWTRVRTRPRRKDPQ